MKACGLVVEYNPFHHGHQYHVEIARQVTNADVVVAVMSGNFYSVANQQSSINGSELKQHYNMG